MLELDGPLPIGAISHVLSGDHSYLGVLLRRFSSRDRFRESFEAIPALGISLAYDMLTHGTLVDMPHVSAPSFMNWSRSSVRKNFWDFLPVVAGVVSVQLICLLAGRVITESSRILPSRPFVGQASLAPFGVDESPR